MEENGAGGPALDPTFEAGIREHWDDLMDDVAATADEFRDRGWDVLELHPGDVTVVSEERRGFDVLVPDDEFERLEEWVADCEFDDHNVYRATTELVFVLVVLRDDNSQRAVCCPLYYAPGDVGDLQALAEREGRLYTHVRRLSEEYVTLVHEEPSLFFPGD